MFQDEELKPRREVEVRYKDPKECPSCSRYTFVEIEVNSNIEKDPHEGLVGSKCLWCDHKAAVK